MRRGARFDATRDYRHALTRRWGQGPELLWVLLNPSTADHESDDPTIRRCIGFSRAWGFGAARVVNLFDLCSTYPSGLRDHVAPESEKNTSYVLSALQRADWALVGWGTQPGRLLERSRTYRALRRNASFRLRCLGTTRSGEPRHPLYVRSETTPADWPSR